MKPNALTEHNGW